MFISRALKKGPAYDSWEWILASSENFASAVYRKKAVSLEEAEGCVLLTVEVGKES